MVHVVQDMVTGFNLKFNLCRPLPVQIDLITHKETTFKLISTPQQLNNFTSY